MNDQRKVVYEQRQRAHAAPEDVPRDRHSRCATTWSRRWSLPAHPRQRLSRAVGSGSAASGGR
ncbi:hypothetical protein, partial [Oceanibaculum nanhaiense]|uniref:hypothetical protein n=1 Tax=Oceanibaculum nanhaiense TaxID=1909734 RepID=UPI003D2AB8FF